MKKEKKNVAELLKQNKIRLARLDMIQKYQNLFEYHVSLDMFVDVTTSNKLKGKLYLKLREEKDKKEFLCFKDAIEELKKIKGV